MRKLFVSICALAAAACGPTEGVIGDVGATEPIATSEDPLVSLPLSPAIESDHPYADNVVRKWSVKAPSCTTRFRIHFDYIDLEDGYDFVRITDAAGNKVKSYTGKFEGWSPELTGTEATLELVSDGKVGRKGFRVDALEYGYPGDDKKVWKNTLLSGTKAVKTPHPYGNDQQLEWVIQGPPGALKMRLRFKRFDTEAKFDVVTLHQGDLKQVATYSGSLGNFTSAAVDGDTVVVRLSSDYTQDGYGFEISSFDALLPADVSGACPQDKGCLVVTPNSHDFGTVGASCGAPKTFEIRNTCTAPVTLQGITLASGSSSEFSLSALPSIPSAGLTVAPKTAPLTFDARYVPTDLGADKAVVTVDSLENGKAHSYTVSLVGAGDQAGANVDTFVQQSEDKADILLVIDNSCSMAEEQQALATNFDSFIQHAKASGTDFNIAVVTTDVASSNAGKFVSGTGNTEKVLTQSTPGLVAKFKAKVNVGTAGSSIETCLEASHLALATGLLSTDNAGFLRNDASLAVVCVTDALDQGNEPVSFYKDELLNLKGGRANLLTYNVVGPFFATPPVSCSYDDPFAGSDPRYQEIVSTTGGVKEEICTPDWAAALKDIGKAAAGFRTQFTLTAQPGSAQSVVVKVGGVAVPATDATGKKNWSIDIVTGTLTFETGAVPPAGAKITVEYQLACT